MVTYSQRPDEIDGCWAAWDEQDVAGSIRSTMDDGSPKVRLRFTGVSRRASVSVLIDSALVGYYQSWYRTNCQQGVQPTNLFEPDGTESIWRFITPPAVSWGAPGTNSARISIQIERLPGWQVLP